MSDRCLMCASTCEPASTSIYVHTNGQSDYIKYLGDDDSMICFVVISLQIEFQIFKY